MSIHQRIPMPTPRALLDVRAHEIVTLMRELRNSRDAYFMLVRDEPCEETRLEYAARYQECHAMLDRLARL